jgi:cytochrome c peroxidase
VFRPRKTFTTVTAAFGASLLLAGAAGAGSPSMKVKRNLATDRLSFEMGRQVFFHETFDGNGRTCATCHDPRNEFTITPRLVQERFAHDPTHPLFRAIDSDDGAGQDYTTMLLHAVFRVSVPLHDNVRVVDDPGRRVIKVWRGVPSVANVALTSPYQQDGRVDTLPAQARGAVRDHMEPKRKQFMREVEAIKVFLVEILSPQSVRALLDDADPVPLAPGFTLTVESPAAVRGKAVFDLRCRRCHGGELGHVPDDPTLPQFADVFVSDSNVPGFPYFNLAFKQPDGSEITVFTPDPGRGAITGDILDLNAFDIPPLRGLKLTPPFFHDNSAATLREVVEHYDAEFQFHLSPGDVDDLITYLELL